MAKGRKSSNFSKEGIESLAKNKPVVYKIFNSKEKNIYTGVAKRGRVEQRLKEHLPGGSAPVSGGVKLQIQQKPSIDDAKKSETIIIKRDKPRFNKQDK